jgi:DnaJ-class molecular chaperone
MATCYKCNGKGTIEETEGAISGDMREGTKTQVVQCPVCRGTGKL